MVERQAENLKVNGSVPFLNIMGPLFNAVLKLVIRTKKKIMSPEINKEKFFLFLFIYIEVNLGICVSTIIFITFKSKIIKAMLH